mgnify:CR=1 FL=1
MEVVKDAMANIPPELQEQFVREQRSVHAQGVGTSKNRLSKGEKKRAKRNRRKYGYGRSIS